MVTNRVAMIVIGALAVAMSASCRSGAAGAAASAPPIVQPGAPGQASRVITAEKAADLSRVQHTPADVRFMQNMIGHHAQAIEMTGLLSERTRREDMRLLGKRIELSQADEIKMMRDWLAARGQPLPAEHAHHAPGAPPMPGMLSAEEMTRLKAAQGAEFDRLFLEYMIKHHDGALTMVKELLATPGAGQESDIFAFAADVDADQRMEIDRMDAMLKELQK
jgi:uncharacterized protein (DUF305 family)